MPIDQDVAQLSRRDLLGRLGTGLGALTVLGSQLGGRPAQAQMGTPLAPVPHDPKFPDPPTWETETKELAPNVYAYIQGGGPGRDNVSVSDAAFIVGDDGVFVFDALGAPKHAKAFIAAIRKLTDKPFRHLVISHHHGDHIAGNQYFEGAEIVGHPYCRDEVLKQAAVATPLWAKREGWADGTEPKKILAPTTTFDGKLTYRYGKTDIEVFAMAPAHTYGDIVAYLPQHKILFAGDIAFYYVAPFCQNAHVSNWIEVCNKIDKMDVQTIVPGHGPLGGKKELAEMRDYLVLLKAEARKRYDAKMTAGAAAADIRMGKYDNWVGPERIVMDVQRCYLEFSGKLTADMDVAGIRQASEEYNAARKASTR